MTFSDYMNSLSAERMKSERGQMVEKVADACFVSEANVWNWIAGRNRPTRLQQQAISSVLNMPAGELFPEEAEEKGA